MGDISHAHSEREATIDGEEAHVSPPRKTWIGDLADESISYVLEYLRAVDLCAVSETDKSIFQIQVRTDLKNVDEASDLCMCLFY